MKAAIQLFVRAIIGIIILTGWPPAAAAEPWNLPQILNDRNTEIRFVCFAKNSQTPGKVSGTTGRVWLDRTSPGRADYRRIRAKLSIPFPKLSSIASQYSGGIGSLIDSFELPQAQITVSKVKNICTPEQAMRKGGCNALMEGSVLFGSSVNQLVLPVQITGSAAAYLISGSGTFYPSQVPLLQGIEKVVVNFQLKLGRSR